MCKDFINYFQESEKYRPKMVRTLLIAEAPPPSRTKYFYVPRAMSNAVPIEKDRSLPATIFHHYFRERPKTKDRYAGFLLQLQEKGIFLIDICDEPIKVRGSIEGVERIITEIPKLRQKMAARSIQVPDRDIVFLLARNTYEQHIRAEFPDSDRFTWKEFRMSSEPMLTKRVN